MVKYIAMIHLCSLTKTMKTIYLGRSHGFSILHMTGPDIEQLYEQMGKELGLAAQKFMKAGKLVPDEVMVNLISSELKDIKTTPWLLDGFPRTRPQAEALHSYEKLDLVLSLEVPSEVIIDRIKGRWTHLPSGRIYHTEFNPPKISGKDDITGEDLVQREDDKEESVKQRLELYAKNTGPLKEFYQDMGILKEFHGTESNEIWPRVHKFLQSYIPSQSGPF
ncbi:unnamed protein product, partial [Meganyctiphanes norvegica]